MLLWTFRIFSDNTVVKGDFWKIKSRIKPNENKAKQQDYQFEYQTPKQLPGIDSRRRTTASSARAL